MIASFEALTETSFNAEIKRFYVLYAFYLMHNLLEDKYAIVNKIIRLAGTCFKCNSISV